MPVLGEGGLLVSDLSMIVSLNLVGRPTHAAVTVRVFDVDPMPFDTDDEESPANSQTASTAPARRRSR